MVAGSSVMAHDFVRAKAFHCIVSVHCMCLTSVDMRQLGHEVGFNPLCSFHLLSLIV